MKKNDPDRRTAASMARYVPTAFLAALATAALLSACTQQEIYKAAQDNAALECQRYPDTRYEECMSTVEKSYADYDEELKRVDQPPRPDSR